MSYAGIELTVQRTGQHETNLNGNGHCATDNCLVTVVFRRNDLPVTYRIVPHQPTEEEMNDALKSDSPFPIPADSALARTVLGCHPSDNFLTSTVTIRERRQHRQPYEYTFYLELQLLNVEPAETHVITPSPTEP